MKQLLPIVMALGLTAVAAVAQTPLAPQEFAAQAAFSNMFGVESATLALHKTTSPKIKSFAHRLANDHATTGSSLRQITARRSDIALPERPDARHLDLLRDLAEKKGEDFDRAYVEGAADGAWRSHSPARGLCPERNRSGAEGFRGEGPADIPGTRPAGEGTALALRSSGFCQFKDRHDEALRRAAAAFVEASCAGRVSGAVPLPDPPDLHRHAPLPLRHA